MTIGAKQIPLYEQLEDVPLDARLVIEDSDGMGATILAIGRMCHGAAAALRAAIEQPRQWQWLTHKEIVQAKNLSVNGDQVFLYSFARAIEAKLKEKNNA